MVDWAAVIAAGTVLDMQLVLNLAYKALSDQQNTPSNASSAGVGFERDTYGTYFRIRAKGTTRCLNNLNAWKTEGAHVKLRDQKGDKGALESMVSALYFETCLEIKSIDMVGVLHRRFWGVTPCRQWPCG